MKRIDPETYQKPSRFMKFNEGENRIRVLSDGFLYWKYGMKARGRYLAHIVRDDDEPIPELFSKIEPKQAWGWVSWDFASNSLKILECGPMLGDQIAILTRDGNYQQKDMLVNKKKTGPRDTDVEYSVSFAKENNKLPHIGKTEAALYLKYFSGDNDVPTK